MKRLLRVIVVVVTLGLAAVVCLRLFSDPVPMERLHRLRKGMTQDEVRSVLGPPTKNIHWGADGTYDGDFNYERF